MYGPSKRLSCKYIKFLSYINICGSIHFLSFLGGVENKNPNGEIHALLIVKKTFGGLVLFGNDDKTKQTVH